MKYRVSELEGALLDAAVAKAEGWYVMNDDELTYGHRPWTSPINGDPNLRAVELGPLQWSTDWRIAGPIIERERIRLGFDGKAWCATLRDSGAWSFAETALIAAMRAYVASKFGEEVEISRERRP